MAELFSLHGFQKALDDLAKISDGRLPKAVIDQVGAKAIGILSAASKASGGVWAAPSQFKVKHNTRAGTARIVGWGFAVLDEYGSFKKPHGYAIEPSYGVGRGQYGKSRQILGNKSRGFAAAYVDRHPPIKAHPFEHVAEPLIGALMEKAMDLETIKALSRVGLG